MMNHRCLAPAAISLIGSERRCGRGGSGFFIESRDYAIMNRTSLMAGGGGEDKERARKRLFGLIDE